MYTYEYRLHFNARHDTSQNISEDTIHPHTFQLVCTINQQSMDYIQIEKELENIISEYRGCLFNEKMKVKPTIENIGEMLFDKIQNGISGVIQQLDINDKPTQIVRIRR